MGKKRSKRLYEANFATNSKYNGLLGKGIKSISNAALNLARPIGKANNYFKNYNYLNKKITDPDAQDLLGFYKNEIPSLGLYKDREHGRVMRDFNNIMKAGLRKYDTQMANLPRKANGEIDDEQMAKDFKNYLTNEDPDRVLKYDVKRGKMASIKPMWAALKDFEGSKIGSYLRIKKGNGAHGTAEFDTELPFGITPPNQGERVLFARPTFGTLGKKVEKLYKFRDRNSKDPFDPQRSVISNLRREIDGEDGGYDIYDNNPGSEIKPGISTSLGGTLHIANTPDTAEQVAKDLGVLDGKSIADRKLKKPTHEEFWNAINNTSKLSESWFSKEPKIDLKKMSKCASDILNKFGSVFKTKSGKDCEDAVNNAMSSESPNKVLRNFIDSNIKKDENSIFSKFGNAVYTWLDMADYAYNIAVKRNKNKLFCILMYAYVILQCLYISIPGRILLPFANHDISNKKVWKRFASSWGWPQLLFNFILTLWATYVFPNIVGRVFSGDLTTILFLVIFNIIFHQSDTALSEPIN
jgi:hypothetical protein